MRRGACAGAAALVILLGMVLGACASPEQPPRPAWTPLPVEAATPVPTPRATPAPSNARRNCLDDARFLEDLTLPDGSIVLPGEALDKRWSVLNAGTCDWGSDYRLRRIGEDAFEGPQEIALYPARAGSIATWQVLLTAPSAPGDYLSRWQALSPEGARFGDEVFLLVIVDLPTPTPTSTPLVAPTDQD